MEQQIAIEFGAWIAKQTEIFEGKYFVFKKSIELSKGNIKKDDIMNIETLFEVFKAWEIEEVNELPEPFDGSAELNTPEQAISEIYKDVKEESFSKHIEKFPSINSVAKQMFEVKETQEETKMIFAKEILLKLWGARVPKINQVITEDEIWLMNYLDNYNITRKTL